MIAIQNALVNSLPSSYLNQPQHIVPSLSINVPQALLVAKAEKIKLKKSQQGIFSVMTYFIKFGFKEGCFIKQSNYAIQLKKFGYKALRRQQVGIICAQLVEIGIVKRIQRHRRAPYEYYLTPLGETLYAMQNPGYQKQAERRRDDWPDDKKPYIETDKNRTSQLRSSFNKTSYKNFGGKTMHVKSQQDIDRDKLNEMRATERAKEALRMEGLEDPFKNALPGVKVDYEKAREYNAKLSSYTCYFRNSLQVTN